MPGHKDAHASLFLIELIIAILFFALGSAVCAQAFAQAFSASRQAKELAFASTAVSSAANVAKYSDGTLESFQQYFPGAWQEGEDLLAAYDADMAPCAAGQGQYVLRLCAEIHADVCYADIAMCGADGSELYSLALHWPAGAGQGGAP